MPRVGFEPTNAAIKWSKTVHAIDRAAIVIAGNGCLESRIVKLSTR
jgi:hypothetical protein